MKHWIKLVGTGKKGSRDLTYDEAVAAGHAIARKEATDAQAAAFFMAVRMKGEARDEIMAFVDVFRKYSLPIKSFSDSINCAGPYDGRNFFPITIPVSLLLASVGVPQVLHGSSSLPPKLGTPIKDLLSGLGIKIDIPIVLWEEIFSDINIGFIWSEKVCPPLAELRRIREEMGLRTLINTVEKAMNPIHSKNIIFGVNHRTAMERLIDILPKLGFENAYIVQGIEGSEDLPIYKNSAIRRVNRYGEELKVIDPETFGFHSDPLPKIDEKEQIRLLKQVIHCEDSPDLKILKDHVIFNAGLRLYWFDKVDSYEEGFQLATSLYERKETLKLMKKWVELTGAYETNLLQQER
jgi:anthranilate phosphoribosyltransferase